MSRIGILGGTFNPIHNAHISLALQTLEEDITDYVLLMPSGCSYLKNQNQIVDAEHRLSMARLAAEADERLLVSDMEVKRQGNSYTADTITELQELYPEDELFYIVGADSLVYMDKWVRPQEIFNGCTVLCAARDDIDAEELFKTAEMLHEAYKASIRILRFTPMDISSTDIRSRVKNGLSLEGLVCDGVAQYIAENGLYKQ